MEQLGRMAAACKGWRWLPGMLDDSGERVLNVYHVGPAACSYLVADGEGRRFETATMPGLPFFDDPATSGCLLSLVREAWLRFGEISVAWDGAGWCCYLPMAVGEQMVSEGATMADALVAALESAP